MSNVLNKPNYNSSLSLRGQVVQNRLKIQEIAKTLPVDPYVKERMAKKFFVNAPGDLRDMVEDVVSKSFYLDQKEWAKMVKITFDRAIRVYSRDRLRARELVNSTRTDSEFYQWLVGTSFTADFVAAGSAKPTASFDFSSRFARIYKAGLALEFTDELRKKMNLDLMSMSIEKVTDAFDELEAVTILDGLFKSVANGTRFFGKKYPSHILDASKYTNAKMDHEKMLEMMYLGFDEGWQGDILMMNSNRYFDLLKLEPFKDSSQKWTTAASPRAVAIIEGATPGKPILPGMSVTKFVHSPLIPIDKVLLYRQSTFFDFAEQSGLESEVAPHDGLHDVSMVSYRTYYGVAAREPNDGVMMKNTTGFDISTRF